MAPLNFYQIYVIYAEIFDKYILIVFGILSSKTEETHSRFFEEVKRIAGNNQPIYWIFDFEPAPLTCANKIFPQTKFYFCLFHLSQIVWRDIQQNDLVKKYKNSNEFLFYIKMLLSIAFVPKNNREIMFEKFKENFNQKSDNNNEKSIIELFNKKFIKKFKLASEDWGCYERFINNFSLSTNFCEGFNRSLNSLLKNNHTSLTKLLMILRTQDHIKDKKINEIITMSSITNIPERSKVKRENLRK
ncbi:hypothetical protein DMUE_0800 [Dictyocoela muelleri]|nr:hypothetical protein DMUE_0800 [Dictyocoela muelleri]